MMGAGVVIAFYSQSCEATGALASDFVLNDGLLTTMLAPSGLGPLVKDGRCGIDFNIRGTIRGNFTGTVYADISGKYSDLADDPDLVAGLKAPQFSWTLIRGESNVQGGGGNGSIEERAGEGVGGDGGSPEGDRSARRRRGR